MLEPQQAREVGGAALIALALLALLSMFPVELFGTIGASWFESGNIMGPLGAITRRGTVAAFGFSAGILPLLVGLSGVYLGGWVDRERSMRLSVLAGGLLVLIPPVFQLAAEDGGMSGWLGRAIARPLVAATGPFGAGIVLTVLLVLLVVATLGWTPVRRPTRWVFVTAAAGWRWVAGWLEGRARGGSTERIGSDVSDENGPRARRPGLVVDDSGGVGPAESPMTGAAARSVRKRAAAERSGPPGRSDGDSQLPPMDLLTPGSGEHLGEMQRELDVLGEVLVEKLRTFNVESELGGRTTGPVVTQFEVIPAPGVKVNRIANLDRDLALAMRAKTVRIVAPIPGKGAVGVEIPNPVPVTVQVREILESNAFQRSKADLPLALGKDLHGAPYVADLAKMPHCLIAGATGSGKSVCLNAIITSLAYRHTPETLRLLLIDPKMVELTTYGDLPHLRHPVVTDAKDAAGVLKWAMLEMDRRYALLSENGVRSIGEFNRRVQGGKPLRRVTPDGDEGDPDRWIYQEGILPFVVLVVDELADLMMTVQSEVEKPLTLLAQKARAIGLHLLVATQRPSVNVITGLIKANFPCRIAFRVASKTDSRTILDQNGADALLGNGDMLFLPPGQSSPIRMQGAFVSTDETARLIDWYRDQRDRKLEEESADGGEPEEDILEFVRAREAEDATAEEDSLGGDWDASFREAGEVCIRSGQGSTSLLQRKLRIGYGRAARIVDQLHDAGVLGPPDGSKPREILMSMEQFDRMMSGPEVEG